jgi:serine/threonine protein kinase
MTLTVGTRLGPYEITAFMGAGGMGEVWKARDTRLDRIVAIKTSMEQFSERFEREARAIASLNHLSPANGAAFHSTATPRPCGVATARNSSSSPPDVN